MPDPLVLAFDTSAAHCAAALLSGDRVLASAFEEMPRGQAERLMPMLAEVMAKAGCAWRDIDAYGVGVGPGNFTGIRVSVAAARGLALGLGAPAIGITTFEIARASHPGAATITLGGPRGAIFQQDFDGDRSDGPPRMIEGETPTQTVDWPNAAATIARLAMLRLSARDTIDRPAPLYIRPPDAAPAKPVPPVR